MICMLHRGQTSTFQICTPRFLVPSLIYCVIPLLLLSLLMFSQVLYSQYCIKVTLEFVGRLSMGGGFIMHGSLRALRVMCKAHEVSLHASGKSERK
jgi:hypothetical protein